MNLVARIACAIATTAVLAAIGASPASAGLWTPVDSGTTDEISKLDYRADGLRYVTTTGKIFKGTAAGGFALEGNFPGRQFFDIEMSPDGTKGLASADTGLLYRYSGGTWTKVELANTTTDQGTNPCGGTGGPYAMDKAPSANLIAVAWSSNSVAWLVSAAVGQVLKSTDGGVTWLEASRKSDGTCKLNRNITDVAPVVGSDQDVYFVDDYFGGLWRTADQLASTGQRRKELVNCYSLIFRLAVDPTSPNRASTAAPCEGSLHWGFTSDSGTSADYTDSRGAKIRDLAGQAGIFIGVGDAGTIEQTFDGKTVFSQPADGALATKDWRTVDFQDATHAVVAGIGGAMVVSDHANEMPDVVAPTVTIGGPDTVQAGAPTVFAANATDNPGGVGIDPAGFQWSGNGLAPTTAGQATFTFAGPGTQTIRVKARDARGNVSEEASKTITVVQPSFVFPGGTKPPVTGGVAKRKGKYIVIKIKGKFAAPTGYTNAQACTGQVFVRVVKAKRLVTARVLKLSKTCGYAKSIAMARSKIGKAKKLTLVVSFGGNAYVAALTKKFTVKIKK